MNSLELQIIGQNLFSTPQQVSIPMSIPIKFATLDTVSFARVKSLFEKIDSCSSSDLKLIEGLRSEL
jgi:hypothetical protein